MNKKVILPIAFTILLIIGYYVADSIMFDGIKARSIKEKGFQANYFAKDQAENKTAIIAIGGGQWGDYWAQKFAQNDMVGLSLPYASIGNLPKLSEEIELEYFERAINWLSNQKEVNSDKIVVLGASRNAELTLILASVFTDKISGAIAYAPSSVSWSNTVVPYNSDEIKASWTYKGIDIPYIPMEKFKVNETIKLETLNYWLNGLEKTEYIESATIKVENINGPILLFSGNDDQVWPSSKMADMIEKRLIDHGYKHSIQNIKYDNAGHLISGDPDNQSNYRTGTMNINGKNYEYEFGGTPEGDYKAKQDALNKLMEFLRDI